MAAHEYYNSFNGGTPQMMQTQPAQTQHSGAPPPPYQPFSAPSQPQPQAQAQYSSQSTYNLADFKPGFPPPENQYQNAAPLQEYHKPHYPAPQQPQRPHRSPRPQVPQLQTGPPQGYVYAQQRPYASTNNLRPQRSYSEPPSPRERSSSSLRPPHRHHNHKHHHSRPRSRSRERKKPAHGEKNTFLGAIGGSVIGDLIFPGLGTLGGAVLGGWGGHEATKKKQERERAERGERRPRRRRGSYEEEYEEGKRRRGEY